jgi:DNA-binding response OmpR family regulator
MTKVLLVEPDAPLMRIMGWILADAGFEVVGEHDFDEALRTLPELRPDVTVLNCDVTEGACTDRIGALRTRWPKGRVIDLQHLQAQHAHETMTADVTLTKPFHAESLVAAIHDLSAEHESYAQTEPSVETAAELRGEDE